MIYVIRAISMDVVTLKDLDTETDEVYMWPVYVGV